MKITRIQQSVVEAALADVALAAGDTECALSHIHKALELDPASPKARLIEARIRLQQARPADALAALDRLDANEPATRHTPQTMMLRIHALLRAGVTDLAATLLGQIRATFPDDVRGHRLAAGLHLRLDQPQQAIDALQQVLRLQPSDRDSRLLLAQLLTQDQPDVAIAVLEDDPQPLDTAVRLPLARLYRAVDRLRDSHEQYAALLRDHPDDAGLLAEFGQLADDQGDDRLATGYLQHAIRTHYAFDPQATESLAVAHMHAGRFAAAGRCWWQITRRTPDAARAWAGLIVCGLVTHRDKLIRRAQRPLALKASRAERQRLLADLWLHASVGQTINHALRHTAESPESQLSPLDTLLHRAHRVLDDHTRHHPRRADAHYHLALCSHALDDDTRAAAAVDAALALNPHYASAQRLRTQLTTLRLAA